jgi:hypothetical protein
MAHFTRVTRAHFGGAAAGVHGAAWQRLQRAIARATSLEQMREAHGACLEEMQTRCLLARGDRVCGWWRRERWCGRWGQGVRAVWFEHIVKAKELRTESYQTELERCRVLPPSNLVPAIERIHDAD